jgi:hypothetical protein
MDKIQAISSCNALWDEGCFAGEMTVLVVSGQRLCQKFYCLGENIASHGKQHIGIFLISVVGRLPSVFLVSTTSPNTYKSQSHTNWKSTLF